MSLSAEAPRLADWITLTEAAEKLGVTKQAVHRMVAKTQLHTLHKIGSRPVYISLRDRGGRTELPTNQGQSGSGTAGEA